MSAVRAVRGLAGIDVGASGIRAKLEFADGLREANSELPLPRHRGRIDIEQLSDTLIRSVRGAMHDGLTGFEVICIGMAGLPDLVDAPERLATLISRELDASTVMMTGDAVTTHAGALGLGTGTVLAAGTGVVALGTDHEERWQRSDGWGFLIGDEGGGAWIGQRGLAAALRAHDGRIGGSPQLLQRMLAGYGSVEGLVDAIYGAESPSYVLGRFAPEVAAAAAEADPVALGIWSEAGELLAQTAAAAAVDVGERFSWGGGLFTAGSLLLDPFRAALRELRPASVLIEPAGTSADGALLLAHAQRAAPRRSRSPFIEIYPAAG